MPVKNLRSQLAVRVSAPSCINVGILLWQELIAQSEISQETFHPVGMPSAVLELPVLKGSKIFVSVDPKLEGFGFFIP